ncbi:uncharacterized protein LOC129295317 [Prosopis cineraria]|uniref:uncharacterized protein LOC129295317 n=1 Tax=Prosopis cineraria TaxID=364024 RepID=UPI00240EC43A|nr:uncharacterized protein LOC129295317 [Prosopis cineraria]
MNGDRNSEHCGNHFINKLKQMEHPFSWPGSEPETESLPPATDQEIELLYRSTFKCDWEKVTELYKKTPGVQSTVIIPVSSKDTALHVAISDNREEEVKSMVESIVNHKNEKALIMQNGRGETPLHRAATRKSVTMCEYIVEAGRRMQTDLLGIPNKWGETPISQRLFTTVKPPSSSSTRLPLTYASTQKHFSQEWTVLEILYFIVSLGESIWVLQMI